MPRPGRAGPSANLWKTDVDACCNIRKVLPLDRALGDFDAWITGRKRFQGGDRLRLPVVERSSDGKIKINPLANMTKADLDAYAAEHDLPAHPLVAQGFPSIGCWPCTKPVEAGGDVRSGRWAGLDKSECGIHVERAGAGCGSWARISRSGRTREAGHHPQRKRHPAKLVRDLLFANGAEVDPCSPAPCGSFRPG